jgi:hypothetical protein
MVMKQVLLEIKNFTLDYDGFYQIISSVGRTFYASLTLDMILRMMEIEGLSHHEVYEILQTGYPLTFNKMTLIANAIGCNEEEGRLVPYLTSEVSEEHGINKDLKMFEFTIQRDTP